LLNDLATDNPYPQVDQDIEISFTKISNYVDSDHQYTPVPTYVDYTIYDNDGAVVYNNDANLPANSDAYNFVEHSFTWTPGEPGWYDIEVYGICNSGLCNGKGNTAETVTERIHVDALPSYDLSFQIADALTGALINNVNVNIGVNSGTTDSQGRLTFTDLAPGTYSYTLTHSSYVTETGNIEIVDVDMSIYLTMSPKSSGNTAPTLIGLPDIYMVQGTTNSNIDLDLYVTDSQSADSELTWTFAGNSRIGVSIGTNHVVTFTAPDYWTGYEDVTFTVRDPQGATDSDTMRVYVTEDNTAPEFTISLPDITIDEDTHLFDAFHLPDYVTDSETPSNMLDYTITQITNANCDVSIGSDLNVDIQPAQDWNGVCDVTVQVSDGEYTDSDTFTITVNPVNDMPIITSSPITEAVVDELYVYDVEAYDPDWDTLVYSITTFPSGMTIDSNTGLITWTPDSTQVGQNPVRVEVTDGMYTVDQAFIINVNDTAANQDPTVTIIADPLSGSAPLEVNFTAVANDPDGEIVSYAWNFGDGESSGLQNVTHTFNDPGNYVVRVTVTDNDDATAYSNVVINVNNTAANQDPTVTIIADPLSGFAPLEVDFIADANDPDGEIVSYAWNFGDGESSGLQNVTHTFTDPGNYVVRVTVTDNDSATAYANVIISASSTAPTVTISANPTSGQAPLTVDFTSTASDINGFIASYEWNFGDGGASADANTTHIYTQPGTYTATLIVTDNDGETGQDSVLIRVSESSEDDSITSTSLKFYKLDTKGTEVLHPGDTLKTLIKFENVRDLDLDNLRVTLSVPDIGIWRSTGLINLDAGDKETIVLELEIPEDTELGIYDFRVSMTDNYVRKVKVRQFEVI